MPKNYRYYLMPLLIIITLNALLYIFAGTYFENYEALCSSMVQGLYMKPSSSMWNLDFHFLLFSLYGYINTFFPGVQVYGLILTFYNFLAITSTGLVLYRIMEVNLKQKNWILFCLIYLVIIADSFFNIYTNRIAFYIFFPIIGFIESRRFEGKKTGLLYWILFSFLFFYNSLIRTEIVLLCSFLYLLTLVLFKRFYKLSLIPLCISLLVFISEIVVISHLSEARQVFAYKEKDFFDRENIDYSRLTDLQSLQVQLFKKYEVSDKVHFTLDFYNSIAYHNIDIYSGKGKKILRHYLNGFDFRLFLNTLNSSYTNIRSSLIFWIFYLLISLLTLFYIPLSDRRRWGVYFILCLFYPLVICINIILPVGFIIPFYSFLTAFFALIYLHFGGKKVYLISFFTVMLAIILYRNNRDKKDYLESFSNFKETIQHLEALDKKQGDHRPPIILGSGKFNTYLSVDPFYQTKRQHVIILNAYLINSYDNYLDSWKEQCHCNPLSLNEKINYIVSSGALVIIDDEIFGAIQNYLYVVYHQKLLRKDIYRFDTHLKAYRFSYGI